MSGHLDPGGDVVLVALVVRTHARVGEVVSSEVECGDGDPVEAVLARLGEGQRPAEVGGEHRDGVGDVSEAGGEEAVS